MDTHRQRKNPWLGLESYQEGEIIYGRDSDILDLTQCVLNDISTLLYGKSGIGKSSILNAGVIPAARRHGFVPIAIRLSHKAGISYLQQIRSAVEHALAPIPTGPDGQIRQLSDAERRERETLLASCIREVVPCSPQETVYEYFHRHTFHDASGERVNLLIIFDQFEEIFTLQSDEAVKRSFFSEIADMLNNVMPANLVADSKPNDSAEPEEVDLSQAADLSDIFGSMQFDTDESQSDYVSDNNIHLVFTIREDFLSEFEYYSSTIPVLKQNRFGLRPINEEQAEQIIRPPIPGLVSRDVALLIIQKVTGRTDFKLDGIPEIEVDSAVLSLYLNRLYEAHTGDTITAALVEERGGEIISDFYSEAIADVNPATVAYLEDALLNGQGRRDNITVYDAIHEGKVSDRDLDILCNRKKILRQFYYGGVLRIEYVHDILCPIVKAHKEAREAAKKAEEERLAIERETQRLLAEEERKRHELEQKAAEDKAAMEAEARRIRKRNRQRIFGIVSIAALVALFVAALWVREQWANVWVVEKYYAAFDEDDHGWPQGVEGTELSKEQRRTTPMYYRLWRKGHKGDKFTDVQIMTSNEYLPDDCRVPRLEWSLDEDDKYAKSLNDILRNVTNLHYTAAESPDRVSKVEFADDNGVLMTITYFHTSDNDAWASFITPNGQNMKIRENGIDRFKISWDSLGTQAVKYYDALGVPQNILAGSDIKGYEWKRPDPRTVVMYSLNEFGLPSGSVSANTRVTVTNGDSTITRYYRSAKIPDESMGESWDLNISEAARPEGYSRSVRCGDVTRYYAPGDAAESCIQTIAKRDRQGNILEIRAAGPNLFGMPPIDLRTYTDGLLTERRTIDAKGQPFATDSTLVYKWAYDYRQGKPTGVTKYDIDDRVTYSHTTDIQELTDGTTVTVDRQIDQTASIPYVERIDSVSDLRTTKTFYGVNRTPVNHLYVAGGDSLMVHRVSIDDSGDKHVMEFYAYDEGRLVPLEYRKDQYGKALSYFRRIEEYDDNDNLVGLRIEDADGRIMKNMMYFIQNGQNIGRAVKSIIDGKPVRCDKWEQEGFLYYRFHVNYDFEDHESGLTSVDEWGNHSTIYDGLEYIYAELFDFQGKYVKLYDIVDGEFKQRWQTDFKNYYTQLAIYIDYEGVSDVDVPYVHILSTDSKLYNAGNGLIDGDRIVEFGDWSITDGRPIDTVWTQSLNSGAPVHVKVLRPNHADTSFDILEYDLQTDTNESSKAETHTLRLSKEELALFQKYYPLTK